MRRPEIWTGRRRWLLGTVDGSRAETAAWLGRVCLIRNLVFICSLPPFSRKKWTAALRSHDAQAEMTLKTKMSQRLQENEPKPRTAPRAMNLHMQVGREEEVGKAREFLSSYDQLLGT